MNRNPRVGCRGGAWNPRMSPHTQATHERPTAAAHSFNASAMRCGFAHMVVLLAPPFPGGLPALRNVRPQVWGPADNPWRSRVGAWWLTLPGQPRCGGPAVLLWVSHAPPVLK